MFPKVEPQSKNRNHLPAIKQILSELLAAILKVRSYFAEFNCGYFWEWLSVCEMQVEFVVVGAPSTC